MLTNLFPLVIAMAPAIHAAGWVTWTQINPETQVQGVFTGGAGAYAGTVTATVSGASSGATTGINGLIVQSTTNLTTNFTNNYHTNPGPVFPNFGVTYNDSQDEYTVTVDFSGLANGYLPAGSILAILDVDIEENIRDLRATDPSSAAITTAWLIQRAGVAGFLDYVNADGDQTGSLTAPTMSNSAGVYQFLGKGFNDNAALLGYFTTQDIRTFTFEFDKSNNATSFNGTGGYGISIGEDVPEPSTTALLSIAALAFAIRMRRNLRRA
ncbi:MAG: PEP-CTERM sorting domain-containing protein [Acidobacteria bacterium]|nr:PEP-CTERM sorting domain-containing protein [Acidobacteriota bacterium]